MGVGSGHRRVHAASFKARHPACSVGAAKPLLPMNTRRDFLKTGLALGASAVILPSLVKAAGEQAAPSPATGAARPVLVAVKDGSRTAMLDKALAELGGVGRFVKKGQLVVLKPNIGWNATPERGANTHPELVGHMVTLCLGAGASRVVVFDKTCDKWTLTYKRSGIEDAVKAAGGEMMPGNDEAYYKEAAFPKGLVLKSGKVHRMVMEADVFINMPVLKHHSGSLMTSAMKNLMGVIWDRGFYHREDLHQCIADFVTFRAPISTSWTPTTPWCRTARAERASPMSWRSACCLPRRTSWLWTPQPRRCWAPIRSRSRIWAWARSSVLAP